MRNHSNKPKQARALLKRDALIRAGEAEFIASGYQGTTSKSIACRAGVATGTFYQYFENKDELLCEIAQQRIELVKQNLQAIRAGDLAVEKSSVVDVFRESLKFIYEFHSQNPELHQVLEERRFIDPALATILRGGEQELLARVVRFVKGFNFAEPEVVANNLFAMAEGIVHRHVFEATSLDSNTVIEQGAQMLAACFDGSIS